MPERPHLGESLQDEFACLTLNVTIPTGCQAGDKLPVMLWFHGGGFVFGTANYSVLDGRGVSEISSQIGCPTVFVTCNYRLGWFGFLASDDIRADRESLDGGNGNQGLGDQYNALKWVVKHIAAFGGDPDNITIFGQSAGAIEMHVHSPHNHLFKRAILMSGTVTTCGIYTEEQYHTLYLKLLRACGIDINLPGPERLAALRALPASKLLDVTDGVFGGISLPQFALCDDRSILGKGKKLPRPSSCVTGKLDWDGKLMITDCKRKVLPHPKYPNLTSFAPVDEGIIYDRQFTISPSKLISLISSHLPEDMATETLRHYKIHPALSKRDLYLVCESLITDVVFTGPAYYMARAHPDAVVAHWDYHATLDNAWKGYAHHSMDYLFSWQGLNAVLSPKEKELGRVTAEDYIRFANNKGYPARDERQELVCRVYNEEAEAALISRASYTGRPVEWFERIEDHIDAFHELAFEISMRRSELLSLEYGPGSGNEVVKDSSIDVTEGPPI
ncbi:hypothetical protein VNI00_013448 [Paramarasmius palmivorus]|uniref:Carboxylic ester hydrolase n=1 Tax=Paramarasmius palmivorus TaxID=297713 RepID=A0AAW0BZ86_9AGAR